jgi:hypothetical protein
MIVLSSHLGELPKVEAQLCTWTDRQWQRTHLFQRMEVLDAIAIFCLETLEAM